MTCEFKLNSLMPKTIQTNIRAEFFFANHCIHDQLTQLHDGSCGPSVHDELITSTRNLQYGSCGARYSPTRKVNWNSMSAGCSRSTTTPFSQLTTSWSPSTSAVKVAVTWGGVASTKNGPMVTSVCRPAWLVA